MTAPEEKAAQILDALAKEHGDETFVASAFAYYEDAQLAIAAALKAERDAGRREGLREAAKACIDYAHGGISQMRRQVAYACERRIRALADAGGREGG